MAAKKKPRKKIPETFRLLILRYRFEQECYGDPVEMADIAEALGMTRGHLYHMLRGFRPATDDVQRAIAKLTSRTLKDVAAALDRTGAEALAS